MCYGVYGVLSMTVNRIIMTKTQVPFLVTSSNLKVRLAGGSAVLLGKGLVDALNATVSITLRHMGLL